MIDLNQVRRFYEILGVSPSCSMDELKQAYRDQLFIWHPDRFQQNPRLRPRSEERSKLINSAYNFLDSHHGRFSAEQLAGSQPGSTEEFRSVRRELEDACASAAEARRLLNEVQQQAFGNRRHFQNALKRAYSQKKGAEVLAEKLQQQLAEARSLSVFWCQRASAEKTRRETTETKKTAGKSGWRLKQSIWGILILLMAFRLGEAIGFMPTLAVVGLVSWLVIRRSRRRPTTMDSRVIPPPLPGAQIPLSHPIEQRR